MQRIDTEHFDTCVATLEYALGKLKEAESEENQLEYNMARSSCIKEFVGFGRARERFIPPEH